MSRRLLAINATWSLANHLAQRGSLALATIVLARSFTTQDFATYSYYQMTVNMLATYATMGLAVAAARFFAVPHNDDASPSFPLGTLLCVNAGLAFVVFLILSTVPLGWLTAGRAIPTLAMSVGVALAVLDAVMGGAIVGLEAFRASAIVSFGSAACLLALVGLAAITHNPALGMWAIAVAFGVHLIGIAAVMVHRVGWERLKTSMRWDRQSMRALSSLAGTMFMVSLVSGSAAWFVGRLILARGGDAQFAVFAIGMQWLALGLLLPAQVTKVTFSRMVRETKEGLRRLLKWVVAANIMMSLGIAILGFAMASKLILLYGSRYTSDAYIVAGFLGVAVLNAPTNALGNSLIGRGRHKLWLCVTAGWVVTLAGVLALSPHGGVKSALAAYAAAGAVMLALAVGSALRKEA